MSVRLISQPYDTWHFEFVSYSRQWQTGTTYDPKNEARKVFARFLFTQLKPSEKISIVVQDKVLFDELAKLKGHNALRGNVSIVLIDFSSFIVLAEEYVAYYDICEKQQEIKISKDKKEGDTSSS